MYDDGNHTYHLLAYSSSEQSVVYYYSDNGINFTRHSVVLSSASDNEPLYDFSLYKSASLQDENGNIRVYFCGNSETPTRRAAVGVYIAKDWNSIKKDTFNNSVIVESQTARLERFATGKEITNLRRLEGV